MRCLAGLVRRMAASARWSAAASMSASVVHRPTDSRAEARARSAFRPMAVSTGEGVCWPLWQADPVDAAIAGVAASRSWPRTPAMLMLSVVGSRPAGGPLSLTRPGRAAARRSCRRSRSLASRASAPPAFLAAAVDDRLQRQARAHVQGGDAFRRVHLVADNCQQVGTEIGHVDADLPDRLRGVHVQHRALPMRGRRAPAERRRSRCWRASPTPQLALPTPGRNRAPRPERRPHCPGRPGRDGRPGDRSPQRHAIGPWPRSPPARPGAR